MIERIRTALILVTIVLLCMFITPSPFPMMGLMLVTVAIAGFEWAKLINNQQPIIFAVIVTLISGIGLFFPMLAAPIWWSALLIWLISLIWVAQYPVKVNWYNKSLNLLGVILLAATAIAIFALWERSPWWLMYVFSLVWSADSGAYFVGRALGKRKLAPYVSPNKSIEGLMGGITVAMLVVIAVAFTQLNLQGYQFAAFMVLSLITIMASVQGDLFESMLKRQAGIKDSGSILPGHGGVLDRIDSLMAATPIFALGLLIILNLPTGEI